MDDGLDGGEQVKELTAEQLSKAIAGRGGAVYDGVGNGTCWLYAILGKGLTDV